MSLVGRTYPPIAFEIEPAGVAAFAEAVGADPTAGVPPTYAAVYALGLTFPQLLMDEEAEINMALLVHGEQEFEWDRHPSAGETLTATATVTDDQVRRGMRFVALETRCQDASGTEICRSRMLSVIRG